MARRSTAALRDASADPATGAGFIHRLSARRRLWAPPIPGSLGGHDDHLSVLPLALAARRNGGIALQGEMDRAPVPRAHRVQRDGPQGVLGLLGEPARELSQVFEAPLAVTFDVNHHPSRTFVLSSDDAIHDVLQRVESLPPPADEKAA